MDVREERRAEPRIRAGMNVRVTVLNEGYDGPLDGEIVDLSGSGMLLLLPVLLPCGSPVKVEGADTLLLGEVCRCEAGTGKSRVALKITHSLASLAQLERLNRVILGTEASSCVEAATEPVPVRRGRDLM